MKEEMINTTRGWDNKNGVPDRNRTHDLPNTGWALYPLSYEDLWRAMSFTLVRMISSLKSVSEIKYDKFTNLSSEESERH